MHKRMLSNEELKLIRKKYEENTLKFVGVIMFSIIIPSVLSLIPAEFLGRKGMNLKGSLLEHNGISGVLAFILIFSSVSIYLANKYLKPFKLKKDLKLKEVLLIEVQINQQSLIPKKIRDRKKELGESFTDFVRFKKNNYEIKHLHYNRSINPELLKAKAMIFEITPNSHVQLGWSSKD